MSVDEVEKAFLIGPDAKEMAVVNDQKETFRSSTALEKEGSYTAVIKKHGGFSSKTVDGFKERQEQERLERTFVELQLFGKIC